MKVWGIPLKVDASWFLIVGFLAYTLAQLVFRERYPDLSAAVRWQMGLAGAVLLFASVVIHELAHSVVAMRRGMHVKGITLFIFGGVSEIAEEPPGPRVELEMAAVGPAMSFLLALVTYAGGRLAEKAGLSVGIFGLLQWLGTVNFALGVFNLIPGFPLDGGRLLRAYLWMKYNNLRLATRTASYVGSGVGTGMIVLGIALIVTRDQWGGLWLMLIGWFLRGAAEQSYRQLEIRRVIEGTEVSRLMTANPTSVPPTATLSELVEQYLLRYRHQSFPVVDQAGELLGFTHVKDIKEVPRDRWSSTTVEEILDRSILSLAVSPDADALAVMKIMTTNDVGRIPVVLGRRLVGIVSRSDLMRYLRLKMDLGE